MLIEELLAVLFLLAMATVGLLCWRYARTSNAVSKDVDLTPAVRLARLKEEILTLETHKVLGTISLDDYAHRMRVLQRKLPHLAAGK
jgi:hypothetical protein